MKILVVGANSYLGARIYFELRKKYDVVGTFFSQPLGSNFLQLDVTNKKDVQALVEQVKPDVIIHTANNASVRWCEAHPNEARALNQMSTGYLVEVANSVGAKVVYISSFAAYENRTVYAQTKIVSEDEVKKTRAGYLILRPSLIVGFSPNTTNDRPFNRILKNLDEKTPASYDNIWKFQPTYIGHVSEVLQYLIEKNIWNKIIPIAVPELKTRFDLAKDILGAFGITDVVAVDGGDLSPTMEADLSPLAELDLPQYSYDQILKKIIGEIKEREKFGL